jgi:hypothetical protein
MKLDLNLTWAILTWNPMLDHLKDRGIMFLHPNSIKKASNKLQDRLMTAYKEYIFLCLSGPVDEDSVEYTDAVNKIKIRTKLIYQEIYNIKPVYVLVEVKVHKVTVSQFRITEVIEQNRYDFQKTWATDNNLKYLTELFVEEVEISLIPKYIYRVKGLAGQDGYLYQHIDQQGFIRWAILVTDKLIW